MARRGWRDHCIETIHNRLDVARCVFESWPSLSELRTWIDQDYPFIVRSSFPYKVWVQELNLLEVFLSQTEFNVEDYTIWRRKQFKRKPRRHTKAPGQLKIPNLKS